MRVLFLLYRGNPYCGGQGIYLYHLSRELSRAGVAVDAVVGPPYPDPMEEWAHVHKLENLNMWAIKTRDFPLEKLKRIYSPWNFADYILTRFHAFPEMETFSMRAFFYVKKLLKRRRYDIIHDINTLGWGNLPLKGFNIPLVSTIHHPLTLDREADLERGGTLWDRMTTILFYPLVMQRVVINRMDRVITSFRGGVDALAKAYGLAREKIDVVYNGIDTELFTGTGEKREENSLLFVGNTEDNKKGLIYLLEALKELPERVTLTIVDEGPPLKMTASKIVKSLGLDRRVAFTGKVDIKKLLAFYRTKTILVMPSLFEGFGLPAVEAMACGTPVVVTGAGALKEVVDGRCGIIVPERDSGALSSAIRGLLENPALRKAMGRAGRSRVEENFSWPAAAMNTLRVYEDVIKKYKGLQ